MPRGRERAFYLTVSLIALGLTAASALTVAKNGPQFGLRQWWQSLHHVTSSQRQMHRVSTPSRIPSTVNPGIHKQSRSHSATPARLQQSGSGLVRIVPYGTNVPNQTLEHTRQLMEQYQITSWDSARLRLKLHQPVTIELAGNQSDYESALKALGVDANDAASIGQETGGYTMGNTIVIPLAQNQTTPDLVNSLAHELTHAYFNENNVNLPSWMNEGIAVDDGMHMQQRAESAVAYMGYAKRMVESVMGAAQNGKLLPLQQDDSAILSSSTTYNLEIQDWIAVEWLLNQQGCAHLMTYLRDEQSGASDYQALTDAFGITQTTLNKELSAFLSSAAQTPDQGAKIQLSVPGSFHGTFHVLPRNSHMWAAFALPQGVTDFEVQGNGVISGIHGHVTENYDSQAPDPDTLYLVVQGSGLTYEGHPVDSAGMAFDVHNGMYGFMNSWITLKSGKTVYLTTTASLFGIQLSGLSDVGQRNPLLPLLQHDPLASPASS